MNKQEYLLTCLSEECSEVQQAVSKTIRFGLNDHHPDIAITNAEQIVIEYYDLIAVVEMLKDEGAIQHLPDAIERIEAKKNKVLKFMEYSKDKGLLKED